MTFERACVVSTVPFVAWCSTSQDTRKASAAGERGKDAVEQDRHRCPELEPGAGDEGGDQAQHHQHRGEQLEVEAVVEAQGLRDRHDDEAGELAHHERLRHDSGDPPGLPEHEGEERRTGEQDRRHAEAAEQEEAERGAAEQASDRLGVARDGLAQEHLARSVAEQAPA